VSTTRTYELGGGKYTATQNADGTWNVLDVPICGEIPEAHIDSHPWNGKPIDRAWMQKTVENHQGKFKDEGFLPPLHIKHHEDGKDRQLAGKFLPTRVGKLQYEGKETDVILADLTLIPDDVFQRIEKGELSYISIEASSWEDGKFTSCAIMDSDAPYFAFPNVTVGEKVTATGVAVEELVGSVGMSRAYSGTKEGVLVLCKAFTGVKLADDGTEKKDDAGDKTEKPGDGEADDAPKDPNEVVTPANDEMSLLKQILTTLNVLAKNFTGVGSTAAATQEPAENHAPVEQEKDAMSDPKEKKPAASAESTVQLAALEGKLAGLTQKIEDREKKDALVALASKYEAMLAGWHVTDSTRKTIALMAEKGEDAVKAFVESFKSSVPKDPPATLSEYEGGVSMSAPSSDPDAQKVLQQYASRGPEVQEQVQKFVAMHRAAKRHGLTQLSVESFVAAQFKGAEAQALHMAAAGSRN
jgi:hypothetical protein